nr:DedA family protein [candidate division Zixibacteria bacterium]
MEQSLNLINEFLERLFTYGPGWIYLALFMASFIENVFPPFPGDFFTITAGGLAASGWLNIFLIFIVVYLGGIASTMLVYYFGRHYGREFFIRKNYRVFSAEDIDKMESWFIKQGALLLVFSRFIVGARAAIALVSGIGRYNPGKMVFFTSLSFWLFNGILLFSSFIFVTNFETIAHYFHMYEKIVWPIIILIVAALIIVKVYKSYKK